MKGSQVKTIFSWSGGRTHLGSQGPLAPSVGLPALVGCSFQPGGTTQTEWGQEEIQMGKWLSHMTKPRSTAQLVPVGQGKR